MDTHDLNFNIIDSDHGLVPVWCGAIRQQAITQANVNPDLYHHMMSLGQNELKLQTWTK